ncbi:MAG: 3-deoxy-D-manno-octulosonic acid transferase [Candidatus Omnitrophica bacterium]|nr:3-deoxy-D-manno-octulosonic acid transferase [Candidatus Omnitrophota bacterium]
MNCPREKRSLLFWVYQAGLTLFGTVYLAARLARGRPLPGLDERLARYTDAQRKALAASDGPVWLHLVSAGEALAARPLVEELRRRFPQRAWVITTVTPTGRAMARRLVREGKDHLLYLPWDLGPVVRRALQAVRPRLFLAFETELWPVLFRELGRREVPVAVVNGRISPRAYRRYLWARPLMRHALFPVQAFFAQSPQDARRFVGAGAAMDRIAVTGNMKWDQEVEAGGGGGELRAKLGMAPGALLWTAGSTHRGEDPQVLRVHAALSCEFPGLRLVIAPRHPERVAEIEQEVRASGLKPMRWSKILNSVPGTASAVPGTGLDFPVVLLDTMGELSSFYAASDVVFVGGSLVPQGGHNLVEPAALSRAVVTGSHLENFQAVSEALAQEGGMAVVKSAQELEQALRRLLRDPAARAELGRRAHAVFRKNRGAAARTAELVARRWGSLL